MSHEATCWAVKQRGLSCAAKVVLWHLADRFHPDNGCFPQQSRLAADCEMSRSSLNVQLDALEKAGLIRREQRHDEGTRQRLPTRYRLGFEAGFRPLKCAAGNAAPAVDKPVENMCETSPDQAESHVQNLDMDSAEPCPENGQSHVQLNGHGYIAEPVSEPVRDERECADAHGQAGVRAGRQADGRADGCAVSADDPADEAGADGSPTLDAFRSVYPMAGHEAQSRLIAAWDGLTASQQKAALGAVEAFVAAGRAGGRKYLPKGAEYLEHRLWNVAEVRAVQAKGKPAAAGGASASFVWVERLKRDWWGVMFARLAEGQPVRSAWGASGLSVPAGDATLGMGEKLRQFPSDGEVAKGWVHWLRAYGFTAPWGRGEQVWLWLPGDVAGDLSGLKNGSGA